MFKFGNRSISRLMGVHPLLVETAKLAIARSKIDFGITCGVRDMETQKKLKAAGRSWTLKSKHLVQEDGFSHAIDCGTWFFRYYLGSGLALSDHTMERDMRGTYRGLRQTSSGTGSSGVDGWAAFSDREYILGGASSPPSAAYAAKSTHESS